MSSPRFRNQRLQPRHREAFSVDSDDPGKVLDIRLGDTFIMEIPHFQSVEIFNRRPVFTVELVVLIPRLRSVGVFNRGPAFTVKLALGVASGGGSVLNGDGVGFHVRLLYINLSEMSNNFGHVFNEVIEVENNPIKIIEFPIEMTTKMFQSIRIIFLEIINVDDHVVFGV